jgi:hypothetical protein
MAGKEARLRTRPNQADYPTAYINPSACAAGAGSSRKSNCQQRNTPHSHEAPLGFSGGSPQHDIHTHAMKNGMLVSLTN